MPTTIDLEFNFRNRRFRNAARGLEFMGRSFERSVKDLGPIAQKELKDMLDTVADAMRQRHNTPWSPGAAPLAAGSKAGTLARRSGTMAKAIAQSVKISGRTLNDIEGQISGPAVHEFGATIRPKRAKFLTIPLPAALDSRGVPLKTKARDWPDTFVRKSRQGNLIIFQKRGRGIVPLYVLKREVKIPPRLGLQATLDVAADVFIDRVFDKMLREIANPTGG